MIPLIAGAAIGLGTSIFGGIKSANAAKKQQKLINQQQAENQAWYNKNYYQDYLARSDSRAALRRVEDFLKRRDLNIAKTAAVTGGTNESVVAQQENAQKVIADTTSNIQSQADMRKDQLDAINQQNKNAILNANLQQQQANEAGGAQLAGAGLSGIANAVGSYASGLTPSSVSPGAIAKYGQMSSQQALNRLNYITQK